MPKISPPLSQDISLTNSNRLPSVGLRLAWVLAALLSVTAFVISFFQRYPQLGSVSIELRFALAEVGLKEAFLTRYISAAEVLMMSICVLIALLLAYKRFNDWMAVFVSLVLFVYGVTITRPLEAFVVLPGQIRWILFTVRMLAMGSFLVFGYVFPDGRFVPGWTRLLAIAQWSILALSPCCRVCSAKSATNNLHSALSSPPWRSPLSSAR